jgi:hypothetical protein
LPSTAFGNAAKHDMTVHASAEVCSLQALEVQGHFKFKGFKAKAERRGRLLQTGLGLSFFSDRAVEMQNFSTQTLSILKESNDL